MMYIKINYGTAVTTLPRLDTATLARATAEDLRVLISLCTSDISLSGESIDALAATIGQIVGCGAMTAAASLSFWRGTGILALTETNAPESSSAPLPPAPPSAEATPTPAPVAESSTTRLTVRRAEDRLPSYSMTDLTALLEKNPEVRENIDECGRIWGNLLNLQETNILLGLSDYLGLEWDYILSLMARCVSDMKRLGMKHSMRYVEKQSIRFFDEGITTLDALQEKFRALDILHSAEGKLRTLFGMGNRIMTPSETKFFSTWLYDFQYDYDIIELAYNIAVDAKGEPRKSYINSILANWNSQNLRTVAAIQAAQESRRAEMERKRAPKKTTPSPAGGGSFDTDSFFDAAVRRSFGEDPVNAVDPVNPVDTSDPINPQT